MGLTALSANRRLLPPEERQVLDDLASILAAADPRIWPLKITRLISSYGSVLAGFGAGQLPMEGDAIGPWTTLRAAETLLEIQTHTADAPDEPAFTRGVLDFMERSGLLIGYGVPFRRADERMVHMRAYMTRCGRADLPYWRLQERVSECLLREKKLLPNVAIGCAAMLLDLGFDAPQAGAMCTFANENTFIANAIEAAEQRAECLRALPEDAILYAGPLPRVSARSAAPARADR